MFDFFHAVSGFCTSGVALRGGLLIGLFIAGALGSAVHCGPMCGVFVLGQMSERMARLPAAQLCEWRRVGNGLLLPYHLGRLTTYAGLGALAAASAAVLGHVSWFGDLSAGLLAVAAFLFLIHAMERIAPFPVRALPHGSRFSAPIRRIARNIPRGSAGGEYLLGMALGFLPCGFLYAALTAAAGSANPLMGAFGMMAFGLGTTPVLMAIGVAGNAAGRRWNQGLNRAAPVLMTLNAMVLLLLAWQRLS